MNHTLLVKKAMEDHLNIIHEARINMVKSFLPAGKIILDLGGANCPLYKMGYTHKFEKLTLIDLPPDQRHDFYKDILIDDNCPLGEVFVRYTDMTTLEGVEDSSVDLVWSGQSIEHVPELDGSRMCQEAFRVLKKGGSFCLDTPNGIITKLHAATVGNEFIHPEHYIEYSPNKLKNILQESGFTIKQMLGICEMPKTAKTGVFHYEDFIEADQFSENVNESYIQFFKCIK